MAKEAMYAFYSETSAAQNGYAVYLNGSGEEVRVTDVGHKPSPNDSAARKEQWPDIEYLGRVESYVRCVRGPGLALVIAARRVELR